jgi:YidC/Oxa1 family membrane protein insertase
MANQRLILIVLLAMISALLWQAWQQDYVLSRTPSVEPSESVAPQPPGVSADTPAPDFAPAKPEAPGTEAAEPASAERVRVVTDVLDVDFSLFGAQLVRAALLRYPVEADQPDQPFVLIHDSAEARFVYQGGLLADGPAPDHRAAYTSERREYRLDPGADSLSVALRWRDSSGVEVSKIYTFKRGSYVIDVTYDVRNLGTAAWNGRQYRQLTRHHRKGRGFYYTFTGVALSTPEEPYQKFDYGDLEDGEFALDAADGWAAMVQHYFVTAIVPDAGEQTHYYARALDQERYMVGAMGPPMRVDPGMSGSLHSRLYVGPKLQHLLPEVARHLELTVDFGVFWVLAKPLFIVLEWIHDLTGNWGWAIIIVTILLKGLFFPLSDKSYRSMAAMRKLQPRMQAIRERYANDRTRMNQAMTELFKNEKLNPLGGCLPILVQIPVFIALYWVLLESVEMRQVPFALWLNDLSSPDPYYVLPVLMGISMFVQQKLSPAAMDPVQQKVMQIMPIALTVFFAFFPSGLVLYWVVNNVLSIAQQWVITRRIEAA